MGTGVAAFFSSMGGFGTQTMSTLFLPVRVQGMLGAIRMLSSMLPAFKQREKMHQINYFPWNYTFNRLNIKHWCNTYLTEPKECHKKGLVPWRDGVSERGPWGLWQNMDSAPLRKPFPQRVVSWETALSRGPACSRPRVRTPWLHHGQPSPRERRFTGVCFRDTVWCHLAPTITPPQKPRPGTTPSFQRTVNGKAGEWTTTS